MVVEVADVCPVGCLGKPEFDFIRGVSFQVFGEFGVESYVFEVLVEGEFEEGVVGEFDFAVFWLW